MGKIVQERLVKHVPMAPMVLVDVVFVRPGPEMAVVLLQHINAMLLEQDASGVLLGSPVDVPMAPMVLVDAVRVHQTPRRDVPVVKSVILLARNVLVYVVQGHGMVVNAVHQVQRQKQFILISRPINGQIVRKDQMGRVKRQGLVLTHVKIKITVPVQILQNRIRIITVIVNTLRRHVIPLDKMEAFVGNMAIPRYAIKLLICKNLCKKTILTFLRLANLPMPERVEV